MDAGEQFTVAAADFEHRGPGRNKQIEVMRENPSVGTGGPTGPGLGRVEMGVGPLKGFARGGQEGG